MMTGYKGYTGILITILAAFNVFEKMGVTQAEFSIFLDNFIAVVGFALTVIGYVSAKLRLRDAGKKTDVITKTIANSMEK